MRTRTALFLSAALVVPSFATAAGASASLPGQIDRAATTSTSGDDGLSTARRINHSGNDVTAEDIGGPLPLAGIGEAAATRLPESQLPSGVENPIVRGSVVISEILFNPESVYDSRGEWFEVVNTTDSTIDLSGWTFGDEVYDIHTISALQIAPGDHAVLARVADSSRNGGVEVDYEFGDAVILYNGGDRVVLRDAQGSISDHVNYGEMSFDRPEGRSLSFEPVIDTTSEVANDDGANWCLATQTLPAGDLASPGAANECRDSDASLVITEVMNNPTATSDSVGEWFEVLNTGAALDLDGFSVQDDDGQKFTVDSRLNVAAGGRAVFARNGDPAANGGVAADYDYESQMFLHNTFDELVITDRLGIQVDAVRWDDGRTFPDPAGASMQLAAAALDNADGASWCLSATRWATGDRGTPGAAGNCDAAEIPTLVITEIMFDPELTPSERQGEWFEVANVGTQPAVLDGFSLRTRSEDHVVSSLTIAGGDRAVLAVDADPASNGGVAADYAYGADLSLFNTSGVVEIVTPNGTSIDRVEYSSARDFPLEKGRSIELGATNTDNALGANWCVTIDRYNDVDFGTPGIAGNCDEPAPAVPLMISEIMRNPAAVSDTVGEWFEIYNPTSDPVDLRNWSISDEGSERHLIRESVIVPAEGFVVVARSGDTAVNGGVVADHVTGVAMVLINGEDELALHDHHGRPVDVVRWNNTDLMPRPNGASMSRSVTSLESFAPTTDPSAWCTTSDQFASGDRGTPGAANTCTPTPTHAIVINEIHRDALAEPDSQGEWIEIHNTGDGPVDISGWTLRDDDYDSFVIPAGTVVEAGEYFTAGRNDASLNGGIEMDLLYGIEIINFNTRDELMLLDTDLVLVDRVAWTADNGYPKIAGATMSLRNPLLDNSVGANWCAAVTDQGNGDLGTPGAENLCEVPDPTQPTTITHSLFATGDETCQGEIGINASNLFVGGAIRSNDDISVNGSWLKFDGSISYADQLDLGWGAVTNGGTVQEPGVQSVPFGWDIAEFAPGGVRAVEAGSAYFFYDGDLRLNGNGVALDAGIHYVDGDVKISSSKALLNQVTIVATGTIKISSSQISVAPYAEDLPALMSGEDSCTGRGIELKTSSLNVVGAVYAPDAKVEANASLMALNDGSFVGSSIKLNGSAITINRRSGFVRVTAICMGSGAEDGLYRFRVRHEGDSTGSFPYDLRVGGNVLHSGSIDAGEEQFVWLPSWAKGVKVIPTAGWINEYGGTASSNANMC